MPDWNELYKDPRYMTRHPESAIGRLASLLNREFEERPVRVWDHCCGEGRHTTALARAGLEAYGSDGSPTPSFSLGRSSRQPGSARSWQWLT